MVILEVTYRYPWSIFCEVATHVAFDMSGRVYFDPVNKQFLGTLAFIRRANGIYEVI